MADLTPSEYIKAPYKEEDFPVGFCKEASFITFSLGFSFALTNVRRRSLQNKYHGCAKSCLSPQSGPSEARVCGQPPVAQLRPWQSSPAQTENLSQATHSTKWWLGRGAWWPPENCVGQVLLVCVLSVTSYPFSRGVCVFCNCFGGS